MKQRSLFVGRGCQARSCRRSINTERKWSYVKSLETMRDHWWWRPGWRLGRSFYTWHVTFDKNSSMTSLIDHYSSVTNRFLTLDAVDLSGLHLTIQGLGFSDEIDKNAMQKVVEETRRYCVMIEPFTIVIGPAHVDAETVQMAVHPVDSIMQLRQALREGVGAVWGDGNVPESMEGFRPHVTLAYSNGPGSFSDISSALKAAGEKTAHILMSSVSLIELNRDRKRYEWREIARLPLGQGEA